MKDKKAINWLFSELPILIQEGFISNSQATQIKDYYKAVSRSKNRNIILAIFSLIGTVCIGLGLILLFAYNWEIFTKSQKLIIAFLPLVVSQILVILGFSNEKASVGARECFSVFNMLAIGGCISLISQIYHIPGDVETFLLTWMLLTLPLVYVMKSTVTAFFYLVGITWWSAAAQIAGGHSLLFWPLVIGYVPFYLIELKMNPYSSKAVWLSSIFCLCLTVGTGISLEKVFPGLWIIIYSCFFSVTFMLGKLYFDNSNVAWQKPFRNYGLAGIAILSYLFTFQWVWKDIGWYHYSIAVGNIEIANIVDCIIVVGSFCLFGYLIKLFTKSKDYIQISFALMPIVSSICYILASALEIEIFSTWIYNFYVIYLGIICIVHGVRNKLLGIVNVGIIIIGVTILTRFIDASMGIMERAVVFLIIGVCFIAFNLFLSKKFSKEESHE